eukprot:TRINITY_DN1057_c0_g1_i1.p1 TRINITY_DN1057_c0_g1~~TRINITY_DN1057_c0_g1_i1.p1  ORF type:complete len:339 (+),score=73.96 TRINITY_DN1057_c0_g1_i1:42-1019(+)
MKSAVLLVTLLLVVGTLALSKPKYNGLDNHSLNKPALNDDLIASINGKGLPWKAGRNSRFEGMTLAQSKQLLGLKAFTSDSEPRPYPVKTSSSIKDLPTHFDARTQWPHCVHPVLNQGDCGSCWAFGSSEAFSDRICIDTNSSVSVVLSPQNLVSCAPIDGLDFACDGGLTQSAWDYMANPGLVSIDCWPYQSGENGTVPECRTTCLNSNEPWKVYKADYNTIETYIGEYAIQEALLKGPVEGAFMVFDDFVSYKSGVYVRASLLPLGLHAIKMIGWGVTDAGVKYWICQNSWGTSWGENGFFNILRGDNECGIESDVVAGNAVL